MPAQRKSPTRRPPPRQSPGAAASSPRARIVLGARRHFLSHGFRGVTMDDLAGELGMSKKTLYAHFDSKLALVQAVLRDKADRVEADLASISASTSADFLKTLHDLLACMQKHTGEILPPFVRDLRREAPELFKIVEDRRRVIIQRHFGSLFVRGQKLGRIRKDLRPDIMVAVLLAATEAIMNPAKIEELGLTPKDGYSTIVTIVLEGVLMPGRRSR